MDLTVSQEWISLILGLSQFYEAATETTDVAVTVKPLQQKQIKSEIANTSVIATRCFEGQKYKQVQIHKDDTVSDY